MKIALNSVRPQDTLSRIRVVTDWLNDARDVAKKTGTAIAHDLYNFGSQHSAVASTAHGKLTPLHMYAKTTPPTQTIFLTPIMLSDAASVADTAVLYQYAHQQRADMYFDEAAMAIYFPGQKRFTATGRGVMLLAMLLHAKYHLEGTYANNNLQKHPAKYYEEQASVAIFEYDLLERVAGKPYTAVVDSFYEAIQREESFSLLDPVRIALSHEKDLKKAFGKMLTDDELHVWGAIAQGHAVYRQLSHQNHSKGLPQSDNLRSLASYMWETHPYEPAELDPLLQASADVMQSLTPPPTDEL